MLVMPPNGAHWWVHYWAGRCPGLVGHLYSPGGETADGSRMTLKHAWETSGINKRLLEVFNGQRSI